MIKIFDSRAGFGAPLNERETKDFLSTKVLNIHLGTLDETGHPNVHPTWFYYDTENNRIYIETSKQGKKTSNLRKNEIVYFCIDDPTPPYKGVRMKTSNSMFPSQRRLWSSTWGVLNILWHRHY